MKASSRVEKSGATSGGAMALRPVFQQPWLETGGRQMYLVGHAGNYDVQEAFAWIKAKLDATP